MKLQNLQNQINGEILTDKLNITAYSTDASVYQEKPIAVCIPHNNSDLSKIIKFAYAEEIPIIPRAAGTSLAGQVVGKGLIIDISKYFREIIELNANEKWVKVQPGVVLDELNLFLKPHGLFFGPETSTSNRCMMGGMVGNNSCGTHALIYGSTRDHTLELKTILSDGSEVIFGELTQIEFEEKCKLSTLEGKIYQQIDKILSDKEIQAEIEKQFPDKEIHRRNTGYAIDLLKFNNSPNRVLNPVRAKPTINVCNLLAGSEGTLAFTTEIKLNLVDLPLKEKAVIPVHLNSLEDAFKANLIALKHNPIAIELMDKAIMDCTKGNISQAKNRFFVKGEPEALLIVAFAAETREEINENAKNMEDELRANNFGFHFPIVYGKDVKKVWNLRKAGLGVLANIPGKAKAVAIIEDTAVNVKVLPKFMAEMKVLLDKLNLSCVYYAHISTGEIHLRPVIDLHTTKGQELFRQVGLDVAHLVKKYNGSLSGEHGDGRLRGEFIPIMLGEKIFQLFKEIKLVWDKKNILNPNKIVDTPQMNTHLRYQADKKLPEIETYFDFSQNGGILASAEKCNGSGDCRKSEIIGGTMCPSFKATKDEKNTTRARANLLRDFLSNSTQVNKFNHKELYEVFDLCLMCKACKSECPSSVDVTKLKAEFLQHYYEENGVPLRSLLVGNISILNKLGQVSPTLFNFFGKLFMPLLGFTNKRALPKLKREFSISSVKNNLKKINSISNKGKVYLFNDEFTKFNDTEIGIKALLLLDRLGYEVKIPKHKESARTYLSKGLVKKAKKIANQNIELLADLVSEENPLIGIEPSAILGFRDEYPVLAEKQNKGKALKLAKYSLTFDEFIAQEIKKGNISKTSFTKEKQVIKLHGHCHQKAITDTKSLITMLSLPENYIISEIPSGCCGMAGSFGYEKEHYELSMKIGEQILFPAIRESNENTIIAASGTSCRCQIEDGTGKKALHPIEILYDAIA